MVLSGLQDQFQVVVQDRLTPLKNWLFPAQVYVQLEDRAITLMAGQAKGDCFEARVLERVLLPPGLSDRGEPIRQEALGDFLADLLLERNLGGAYGHVVLAPQASQWRLVEWPQGQWPADPTIVLSQQGGQAQFGFPLTAAYVAERPLEADGAGKPTSLVVAARRSLVQGWIDTCAAAGLSLGCLEAAQVCVLRAMEPLWRAAPPGQLQVLLDLQPTLTRAVLVRQGVPEYEQSWLGTTDRAAMADDLKRCVDFWRQRDQGVRSVQLWLTGPSANSDSLQALAQACGWPTDLVDPLTLGWLELLPGALLDLDMPLHGPDLLPLIGLARAEVTP